MARFWCKNCEIFIDDNALSKRHHFDSQRHKSSVQRSIRLIHKKNIDENRVTKKDYKPKSKKKVEVEEESEVKEQEIEVFSAEVPQWEDVQKDQQESSFEDVTKDENEQEIKPFIRRTPKKKTSEAQLETKRWNLDKKKSVQLSDSSDDEAPIKITFKKITKKST